MKFSYTAKRPTGETYKGVLEAADKGAFYQELRKTGDTLVSVEPQKSGNFLRNLNFNFTDSCTIVPGCTECFNRHVTVNRRHTRHSGDDRFEIHSCYG